MADGVVGGGPLGPSEVVRPGVLSWLTRTRGGRLTIWACLSFVGLAGLLAWHAFGDGILQSFAAKAGFMAATTFFWLPLLLLFLDSPDNLSKGPRLSLPILSLGVLVGLAAFAVADSELKWGVLLGAEASGGELGAIAARIAFFSFALCATIPVVWNAGNFAKHDAARRRHAAAEAQQHGLQAPEADTDAEAMGALIATVLVGGVGVLAFMAGGSGNNLSIKSVWGLALCGIVIGIFLIVIFLDAIAGSPPVRALSRGMHSLSGRMHWLSGFYNWIDSGLVRLGASVAGMNHHQPLSRYIILATTLACCCVMGWYLPAPLGVIPALVGFVLAMSVSRLWSWVEEDRALAAMTRFNEHAPYRVGFREDFRDETLLGFIFVFALVPIAMMQLHEGRVLDAKLFSNADGKSFLDWFSYFGVELAKAVPIVDWAEIYGIGGDNEMIAMNGVMSRHAVFLARVMVDMVLIASLLQAINISTRNRQQKRLFKAALIKRLDRFVERTEIDRAIRTVLKPNLPPIKGDVVGDAALNRFDFKRARQNEIVDFRFYDPARLRLLRARTDDLDERAFIAAIAHLGNFPLGDAIDQVMDIAESRGNELDLAEAFHRAKAEHRDNTHRTDADDLYRVMTAVREQSGMRDFKQEAIDWMAAIGPDTESIDHLDGIAAGEGADRFQYTRNYAVQKMAAVARKNSDNVFKRGVLIRAETMRTKSPRPSDAVLTAAIEQIRSCTDEKNPDDTSS